VRRVALLAAGLVLGGGCDCDGGDRAITIGAAASLRHVMPELVEAYRSDRGEPIVVTYGASDDLAVLVPRGADVDALILDEDASFAPLVSAGRVPADGRRLIAGNSIALVGVPGHVRYFADLGALPAKVRVAIGDPATVPVGRYARDYLMSIGVWSGVEPHLVHGGDVAAVLAMVVRGDAEAAIVYRTDAIQAPGVAIFDEPPAGQAAAVRVVAAPVAGAKRRAAAARFLDFLTSRAGQTILIRHGFSLPEP
jgi:molybdate transport system substrate-binding protein